MGAPQVETTVVGDHRVISIVGSHQNSQTVEAIIDLQATLHADHIAPESIVVMSEGLQRGREDGCENSMLLRWLESSPIVGLDPFETPAHSLATKRAFQENGWPSEEFNFQLFRHPVGLAILQDGYPERTIQLPPHQVFWSNAYHSVNHGHGTAQEFTRVWFNISDMVNPIEFPLAFRDDYSSVMPIVNDLLRGDFNAANHLLGAENSPWTQKFLTIMERRGRNYFHRGQEFSELYNSITNRLSFSKLQRNFNRHQLLKTKKTFLFLCGARHKDVVTQFIDWLSKSIRR